VRYARAATIRSAYFFRTFSAASGKGSVGLLSQILHARELGEFRYG